MRTITNLLIFMCLTIQVFSQDNDILTIMGRNQGTGGGYGSFGAGYTMLDSKDAIVLNARAAFISGHSLALGVAGYGFFNDYSYNHVMDADVNHAGGYGGILIEPILLPKWPVHISIPLVAGAGGIAYTSSIISRNYWDSQEIWVEDSDAFLFAEPGVELELNLIKFIRLSFGLSYRFTSKIALMNTSPDILEGYTASINFKFGKF